MLLPGFEPQPESVTFLTELSGTYEETTAADFFVRNERADRQVRLTGPARGVREHYESGHEDGRTFY